MSKNNTLYYKIYEHLKKEIISGERKPDSALPSERELGEIFNVNRNTVRQALQLLESDNLIYKISKLGSFVSRNILKQELSTFYSFSDEIKKMGKIPSSILIDKEIIPITPELSSIFKLSSLEKIIHIKRLRLVDNVPIMFENTYLPLGRFKNFDPFLLNKKQMYSIFKEKYNVVFDKATETFTAVLLEDNEILEKLKYTSPSTCMLVTRTAYEKGKVIEYTVSYARGDKFEYKVTLNNI